MPVHDQITIIKDMPYRGTLEEWSNSYSLFGTTPTTDAGWKTLADAIIASEVTCYRSTNRVIRAMGYEAGENHASWSYDYLGASQQVPGTYQPSMADTPWSGDQAGWLRMRVGSTSSGKPKYIRKYFHGGAFVIAAPDNMGATLITKYVAHGALMVGGTLPGSMKWCGPDGTIGSAPAASPHVTTRTLKRRGRRPTPAP